MKNIREIQLYGGKYGMCIYRRATGSGEFWWGLVGFGELWWVLVGSGGLWWALVRGAFFPIRTYQTPSSPIRIQPAITHPTEPTRAYKNPLYKPKKTPTPRAYTQALGVDNYYV